MKLRIIVRANGKATFANTTFSADGFLTTDAMINPGYTRDNGKQNPQWNTWGWSYTGAAGNKAWMPTTYALTFYNGVKINDNGRGKATYYLFPSTPTNQLGQETNATVTIASSPEGSFWYASTNRTGTAAGSSQGVLKGPNAGLPVITAAESYFLQAEAALKEILQEEAQKKVAEMAISNAPPAIKQENSKGDNFVASLEHPGSAVAVGIRGGISTRAIASKRRTKAELEAAAAALDDLA